MENELLKKLDDRIGVILNSQGESAEKIASLVREHGDVVGRLKATDDKLQTATEALERMQADLDKRRFDVGFGSFLESDALLSALPDDLRRAVPQIAMMRSGLVGVAEDGTPVIRTTAAVQFAKRDPVRYVACAGWIQARIKACLANKNSRPEEASKWNARADKLGEAMGGTEVPAETRAALQEDTASEGGFLVPSLVEGVMGWLIKDANVVRASGATIIQMRSNVHEFPSLANDFNGAWTTEEGTIADAAPAAPFAAGSLRAKKRTGLVTMTVELIQDSIVNLMDFVITHLANREGRQDDIQMLEGDGTVFTGLFSVAGINSVAGGSAAIDWVKWVKAAYAGEEASTTDLGVYYQHPWVTRDLITTPVTNAAASAIPVTNMPIVLQPQGSIHPTVIGNKPVYQSAGISRIRNGAPGTETTIYHGNPAYLIVGERMGMTFDVNPWSETEFKKGQVVMRLMRRVGFLVWVPSYFTKLTAITVAA